MADDKPPDDKPAFDPFKPTQPVLPGVPAKKPAAAPAAAASSASPLKSLGIDPVWLGGGAGIGLVVILLIWWMMSPAKPEPATPPAPSAAASEPAPAAQPPAAQAAAPAPAPAAPVILNSLPGEIGSVDDFKQPWDSKKFTISSVSGRAAALVIRLPGGSNRSAASYWGLLLQAPYGRCELELITDMQKLTDDYGYRSSHPMVGDPCSRTVFDPTRYGNIGGVMARGEIVQGTAFRPPLGVEIGVQGNKVLALRTE